ncbi:TetR/AcrR family transcriptional regulator [Bifidobacterium saguinibicoloris]|uniref:TetR/AcrR family transcriptional regulator n=1 Tax=Bifidobacterium saguinibicoloris TaxID=2834433 RepID=UPI001C57B239|nr:TetR/AcrR family transcriptional regulator [Bifidobacterium saguinibicoloris]MBW3079938.1 TetR/AcrR family transcriptional regulator [Bifidobacterium saguinibicoloris]
MPIDVMEPDGTTPDRGLDVAASDAAPAQSASDAVSRPANRRGVSVKATVARARWQRRKKAATRRTIRDVALRLFAEQGYGNVTTQRIADEAGMSVITLFRYFPSKEDLVLGFPTDGGLFADLRREIAERKGDSPIGLVRHMVPQVLGSLEAAQLKDLARRLRIVRSDDGLRVAMYARIPQWTDAVAALWGSGDAVADGDARAAFPVRLSVSIIIDCIVESLLEWSRRCDEHVDGDAAVDMLVEVVSEAMETLSV